MGLVKKPQNILEIENYYAVNRKVSTDVDCRTLLLVPFDTYTPMTVKEKYRGVFEIQRSGYKTSSGEIGLDIRTHASPKVGQDQVSGGVSVLCWHAAPVAYVTFIK